MVSLISNGFLGGELTLTIAVTNDEIAVQEDGLG